LNFDGAPLVGGACSDAPTNCSNIVRVASVAFPAFRGSALEKQQIVNYVKTYYAPFNVQIVTDRPLAAPYSMVMIVGSPQTIGLRAGGILGIAPLDCQDRNSESDISFAFANFVGSDAHAMAVTIGQESAHAYGLGHTANPRDIMYPIGGGAETGFLDE